MLIVDIIIPTYNEENSIDKVIADIPKSMIREIIVVNNNSTDNTAQKASEAGATVIFEPKQGYGNACLAGLGFINQKKMPPDIVAFIDADYSDHPQELKKILDPIIKENYDFVLGSRALGEAEKGALMPQQIFGNRLATFLINLIYRKKFTDLGPFRAIKLQQLNLLEMKDTNYGWTIEMQIKAIKKGLNIKETPVSYRKRIGKSKISGTIKGSILAGIKIITTIFKYI